MSQESATPTEQYEATGAGLLTPTQGLGLAAVAATATIVMTLSLSDERQVELLALILAGIAAVYVGAALVQQSRTALAVEGFLAIIIAVLIVLGLWVSPYWLAAGYFGHALWDTAHHLPRQSLPGVVLPRWYAPTCMLYDWSIGILVLVIA